MWRCVLHLLEFPRFLLANLFPFPVSVDSLLANEHAWNRNRWHIHLYYKLRVGLVRYLKAHQNWTSWWDGSSSSTPSNLKQLILVAWHQALKMHQLDQLIFAKLCICWMRFFGGIPQPLHKLTNKVAVLLMRLSMYSPPPPPPHSSGGVGVGLRVENVNALHVPFYSPDNLISFYAPINVWNYSVSILYVCVYFCIKKCTVSLGYVVGDLTHSKAPEGGAFDSQLVKSPSFPHPPTGVGGWGHTLIGA